MLHHRPSFRLISVICFPCHLSSYAIQNRPLINMLVDTFIDLFLTFDNPLIYRNSRSIQQLQIVPLF